MTLVAQLFDPAALAIVLGGTVLAVLLRARLRDVRRALAALRTLGRSHPDAEALLTQIATLDRIAMRQGAFALDRTIVADADVAAAATMIVDGADGEAVGAFVRHARCARIERHHAAADVWAGAAEVAPAMGMIGTLIGLARMFATMGDPAAIGGAMAVALLATLYGALLANLVAMPIATRLRASARAEAFDRLAIEAPLVALAERERPRAAARAAAPAPVPPAPAPLPKVA